MDLIIFPTKETERTQSIFSNQHTCSNSTFQGNKETPVIKTEEKQVHTESSKTDHNRSETELLCRCEPCGSATPENAKPQSPLSADCFVNICDDKSSTTSGFVGSDAAIDSDACDQTFSDLPYLLDVGASYVEHRKYNRLDVLAQRGRLAKTHPGNMWLYLRQKELLQSFCSTTNHRADKTKIAKELVRMVHKRGGRVLRMNKQTRRWYEVAARTTAVAKQRI